MHINVRDLLAESVGYNRTYTISGERPELSEVKLTRDIEGELKISRLDDSLLVTGKLSTEIQLECHRCLRAFTRPMSFKFRQEFALLPIDDQMPIIDNEIDLAPVTEQEIILGTPIKVLDRPDCPGLGDTAGKYTKTTTSTRLGDRARIKKGSQRGRT